jgi:hypothetical protein
MVGLISLIDWLLSKRYKLPYFVFYFCICFFPLCETKFRMRHRRSRLKRTAEARFGEMFTTNMY